MPDLHARQIRALRIRSTFTGTPFDRFHKGVQYASTELSKILNAHPNENSELRSALRAFVANGPVFDSTDYEDGQACVLDDVAGVLDGDRRTIEDLINGEARHARTDPQRTPPGDLEAPDPGAARLRPVRGAPGAVRSHRG